MKYVKVLFVLEESRIGGPHIYILRLISTLQKLFNNSNFKYDFVFPKKSSKKLQNLCIKNTINYNTIKLSGISKNIISISNYLFLFIFELYILLKHIRKNKYDIVYLAGGSWQFKGLLAAKLANTKVVWHLNDTYIPKYLRILFLFLSSLPSAFIYASHRTKEYYKPLIKADKLNFTIPSPVDTKRFSPFVDSLPSNELLNSLESDIIVGTIANVSPVKDFFTLIHCISEINKKYNNVTFIVVGDIYATQKKYYNKVLKLCEKLRVKNIIFTGPIADVRTVLQDFDIYICTSKFESSPISVWEAMSLSKPIISTNVGDVPNFIANGYSGYIVNVGDSVSFSERISNLIDDPDLRKQFGIRARKSATSHLDIRNCAESHYLAFEHILSNN